MSYYTKEEINIEFTTTDPSPPAKLHLSVAWTSGSDLTALLAFGEGSSHQPKKWIANWSMVMIMLEIDVEIEQD